MSIDDEQTCNYYCFTKVKCTLQVNKFVSAASKLLLATMQESARLNAEE